MQSCLDKSSLLQDTSIEEIRFDAIVHRSSPIEIHETPNKYFFLSVRESSKLCILVAFLVDRITLKESRQEIFS